MLHHGLQHTGRVQAVGAPEIDYVAPSPNAGQGEIGVGATFSQAYPSLYANVGGEDFAAASGAGGFGSVVVLNAATTASRVALSQDVGV